MRNDDDAGTVRGVMLLGGRGARLTLRRMFPGTPLDIPTLDMAHARDGAQRAAKLGADTVFLAYSWGLPPELDEVDRLGFARVVRLYHDAGLRVMAGVMASSYAPQASYAGRDWAARDPFGRAIPAQVGRLYACWNDTEWLDTVRTHLIQALDAGADGVWLMAPWAGGVPFAVGDGLLGAAGCACSRCRAAYAEAADGAPIPRHLSLKSREVQNYLEWRAELTTRRIGEWAAAVREHSPDALVAVEGPPASGDMVALRYGHDPAALSGVTDLYLVRVPLGEGRDPTSLAVSVAAACARLGEQARVAATLGEAYPAARETPSAEAFAAGQTAAVALNAAPVVDGTPFTSNGALTLIVASEFEPLRASINEWYRWLAAQNSWLDGRAGAGPLAIYCPPALTWWKNGPAEPLVDAACQAVIRLGLPLRVVGDEAWDGVKTLIVPPGQVPGLDARLTEFSQNGGRVIALQQMRTGSAGRPLWTGYEPVRPGWQHWPVMRALSARMMLLGTRWHTGGAARRRLARWLRLPGRPGAEPAPLPLSDALVDELAAALPGDVCPRVQAEQPVLFTIWREPNGETQWHLVNLALEPQRVTLLTGGFASGWVVAREQPEPVQVFGSHIAVALDRYKVLRLPAEQREREAQ